MRTLILLPLAVLSASAFAAGQPLLPAGPGDLVPTQLSAAAKAVRGDIERAPVQFAWSLDPAEKLAAPAPFTAESREFWTDIDAAALKRGHAIETTAPGALIRISPAGGALSKSLPLFLEDLSVRQGDRMLKADRAFVQSATHAALKEAGADFPDGTLVMRLQPSLGKGRFELLAPKARGAYLVHVYEPDSPFNFTLQSTRDVAMAGGELALKAAFNDAQGLRDVQRIAGLVTSPGGESFDVAFEPAAEGGYRAMLALPKTFRDAPGLWELHAFAAADADGAQVLRDARTAFSVTKPTARLAGQAAVEQRNGLQLSLPVQIAAPGRYEVRATLFATGPDGALAPVAQSHAAKWLDASGAIDVAFGADLVPAGYGAPFEIRQLELADQGTMAKLEVRERALVIPGAALPRDPQDRAIR